MILGAWFESFEKLILDIFGLRRIPSIGKSDPSFINVTLAACMGQHARQVADDKYDVHKVNAVMLREMGIE